MIGNRIRILREHFELNQTEFGNKIGMCQKSVSKMENGGQKIDHALMLKMIELFECSAEWLLTGKGGIFGEKKEQESKEEVCEPAQMYGSRSLEEEVYELKGKVELLTRFFTERGNFAA